MSEPNDSESIMENFLQSLQDAEDREALLSSKCRAHPDLKDDFTLHMFLFELERTDNAHTLIDRYAAKYPHLGPEFRDQATLISNLDRLTADQLSLEQQQLGSFTILRKIAHGGMGEIFEAIQHPLGRRVAIKIARRGKLSAEMRERFLREQSALAQLHQTHIVPIHAAGEEESVQYFAMQYIDGAPLTRLIEAASQFNSSQLSATTPELKDLVNMVTPIETVDHEETPGSTPETPRPVPASSPTNRAAVKLGKSYFRSVARTMADSADAIEHAHRNGILHRDLKPSNIMIDANGHCWIIDFGLARLFSDGKAVAPNSAIETVKTSVLGTPNYMAPEQFLGEADQRTDVWGLGVTLYTLLALRPAFTSASFRDVKQSIGHEPPPLPSRFVQDVPHVLERICLRAIEKPPEDRYQSCGEIAEDLRRFLRNEPPAKLSIGPLRKLFLWVKRRPGWAAALMLLCVLATGGLRYFHARAQARQRDHALGQAKLLRHTRNNGWSAQAETLIWQAASIERDRNVRLESVAFLKGLDASLVHSFPFGGTDLCFDPSGKQLLVSGLLDSPGHLINLEDGTANEVDSTDGGGPARFDGSSSRLLLPREDRLILWDPNARRAMGQFQLPGTARLDGKTVESSLAATMTDDCGLVASSGIFGDRNLPKTLIWNAEETLLQAIDLWATALAFSPDGTLIALGTEDGRVEVRSVSSAMVLSEFQGRGRIKCVKFHRDTWRTRGESEQDWLLAAGTSGGEVFVLSARRGAVRSVCRGSSHSVHALGFSPDGSLIATSGRYDVRIWNSKTGELVLVVSAANGAIDFISDVSFSPDGDRLAVATTGDVEARTLIWKLQHGRGIRTLRGLGGQIAQVVFSPAGNYLAALGHNWEVAIWNLQTYGLEHVLDVAGGTYTDNAAVAFDQTGQQLAFSAGTEAQLWNLATSKLVNRWSLAPGLQDTLGFHQGDLRLARFETRGGQLSPEHPALPEQHPRIIRIYNLSSGSPTVPIREFDSFGRDIRKIQAPPNLSYFVVKGKPLGSDIQQVAAFETLTGRTIWEQVPNQGIVLNCTGTLLASDQQLLRMPASTRVPKSFAGALTIGPNGIWTVNRPPSGRFVLGVYKNGLERSVVSTGSRASSANAISPDGVYLAWAHADGSICLAEIAVLAKAFDSTL